MAIPTPSFFRIRLTIIIIGFVVLCLVVGVVKDVLAASIYKFYNLTVIATTAYWDYGNNTSPYLFVDTCTGGAGGAQPLSNIGLQPFYQYIITRIRIDDGVPYAPSETQIGLGKYHVPNLSIQDIGNCDEECPGGIERDYQTGECPDPCQSQIDNAISECGELGYQWINKDQCLWACKPDCSALLAGLQMQCGGPEYVDDWDDIACEGTCKCDDESKGEVTYGALKAFCGSAEKTDYDVSLCRGRCKDCSIEYQQLEMVCGLNGLQIKDFNFTTCDGSCTDDCSDEYNALEAQCLPFHIINWNEKTCSGECEKDCTTEYNDLEAKCGIAGIASFNNATCTGQCKDCAAREASCRQQCAGQTINYECNEYTLPNGYITGLDEGRCACTPPDLQWGGGSPGLTPGSFGGSVKKNPDGSSTETLPNGTSFTYSADGKTITARKSDGTVLQRTTNPDGSISYYTQDANGNYTNRTVTNVDGTQTWSEQRGKVNIPNNPPSTPDTYFNPVIDNTNPTQTNSGTSQTGITTNAAGNTVQLESLENDVQDIKGSLSEISTGSFTAPTAKEAYQTQEHSFGGRTSQFLNNMKTTGLFSLPNQLASSMPSGGESTFTISSGETFGGDHTIDFNWLSAGLTTLKYLFQIAGMTLAIRIVTLKR